MPRLVKSAPLLIPMMMLGACAQVQHEPIALADLNIPEDFRSESGNEVDREQLAQWWVSFNDPLLSAFIEEALVSNNNLEVTRTRLRSARASLKGTRGSQLPSVNASGSASRSEVINGAGFGGTSFQAGLDASWEADIFGRLSGNVDAAIASAEGSEASLADAHRSLTAEVALSYVDARSAQARLAVAQSNLAIQDRTLQIVRWRNEVGLTSGLEVQQSITQRAQTAANIPSLEQSFETSANQLAVLLGKAPGAITAELLPMKPVPLGPDNIEAGLPAELIARRPDIAVAQKTLVAELARIGVAEAQLYPALRLSGSLSTSSASLDGLGSSIIGNLISSLSAPLFQGGQLRAQIEQQQASADGALASYKNSILLALQDVENALVSIDRNKQREIELAVAVKAAREALRLAEARYTRGVTDLQTVLNAQQSLLSAEDSHTSSLASRATASIQLFKALGGGWQPSQYSFPQAGS